MSVEKKYIEEIVVIIELVKISSNVHNYLKYFLLIFSTILLKNDKIHVLRRKCRAAKVFLAKVHAAKVFAVKVPRTKQFRRMIINGATFGG